MSKSLGAIFLSFCEGHSLVSVRLLLGSEGYDGEWRHMTPPPEA